MTAFTMTQTGASLTATSSTIKASGGGRRYLSIKNTGAETCFLGFGGPALTTGYALPAGEAITWDNYVPAGLITGICAATKATTVAVLQG